MSTHDNNPHPHEMTPDDIRGIASQLEALGEHERRAAENAVLRTTMRTTHLLTDREADLGHTGFQFRKYWLWFAAPAIAAAGVLLAVATTGPRPASPVLGAESVEALAADIESDIEAWAAMDSVWSGDSFETSLVALSIDAAEMTTDTETYEPLPVLDSDL